MKLFNSGTKLFQGAIATVPLDLNFTYARVQKATARNIHGNAPEYLALAPE